jgi:hypothetical protein
MCIPKLSKLSQKQASCVFKNLEALVISKNCKSFLSILKPCTEIYFSHYKLCENELMEIDAHKISYKMMAHSQGLERQQQIWVCPLEWETK